MGKRDDDIITLGTIKALKAIEENKNGAGWTRLSDVGSAADMLPAKFVEFMPGQDYVRLTPDAQTIFNFSQSLERPCPPAKK